MRFAVSAKTLTGRSGWVGAKQHDGSRTIVPHQEDAQIFRSHNDAQRAIDDISDVFQDAGFQFVIRPLDTAAKIDCQDPQE